MPQTGVVHTLIAGAMGPVTGVMAAGYGGSLDTRNVRIFGLCGGGGDREDINVLMLFRHFFHKMSLAVSLA